MGSQVLKQARKTLRDKAAQQTKASQEAAQRQQEVESLYKDIVRPLIDKEVWALNNKTVRGHKIKVENIGFFAGRSDILAVSSRYGSFYVSTGSRHYTFRGSDESPEQQCVDYGILITEEQANPDYLVSHVEFPTWRDTGKQAKARQDFIKALTAQVIRITTFHSSR